MGPRWRSHEGQKSRALVEIEYFAKVEIVRARLSDNYLL